MPDMPSIDLTGKNVLVTGGSSGIGAAVVDLFLELGAQVSSADLQPLDAVERDTVTRLQADVCVEQDCLRATAEAMTAMGAIDVLVNCAGIPDTYTPTLEQSTQSWQRIVDVDLTGTYLMCKADRKSVV